MRYPSRVYVLVTIILLIILVVIYYVALTWPRATTATTRSTTSPYKTTPTFGMSCSDSAPCGGGFTCDGGTCKRVLGQPCTSLDQCESSATFCNGLCGNGAIGDFNQPCPCNEGLQCVSEDGVLVCKGATGTMCTSNNDCASKVCTTSGLASPAYLCAPGLPLGHQCSDNDECNSGNCSVGICQYGGVVTGQYGAYCSIPLAGSTIGGTACVGDFFTCDTSQNKCVFGNRQLYQTCSSKRFCAAPYVCAVPGGTQSEVCLFPDTLNACPNGKCISGYRCSTGTCQPLIGQFTTSVCGTGSVVNSPGVWGWSSVLAKWIHIGNMLPGYIKIVASPAPPTSGSDLDTPYDELYVVYSQFVRKFTITYDTINQSYAITDNGVIFDLGNVLPAVHSGFLYQVINITDWAVGRLHPSYEMDYFMTAIVQETGPTSSVIFRSLFRVDISTNKLYYFNNAQITNGSDVVNLIGYIEYLGVELVAGFVSLYGYYGTRTYPDPGRVFQYHDLTNNIVAADSEFGTVFPSTTYDITMLEIIKPYSTGYGPALQISPWSRQIPLAGLGSRSTRIKYAGKLTSNPNFTNPVYNRYVPLTNGLTKTNLMWVATDTVDSTASVNDQAIELFSNTLLKVADSQYENLTSYDCIIEQLPGGIFTRAIMLLHDGGGQYYLNLKTQNETHLIPTAFVDGSTMVSAGGLLLYITSANQCA